MAVEFDPTLANDANEALNPILAMGLITAGCAWDSDGDDASLDGTLDSATFSEDHGTR